MAYIDIDFILKNSDIGKKTLEKINTQNNINIQDLKKKEKILKDLEIEIASKKNIKKMHTTIANPEKSHPLRPKLSYLLSTHP